MPKMLLLAVTTAAAIVLLSCRSATAAAEAPLEGPTPAAEADGQCTISAAAVAEAAQQVCGGAPIEAALRSVHLRPEAAEDTGQMLVGLGFQTALDLQLLAGGPEAAELLGELKAGGLRIGDRAKVRLLVEDKMHHGRLASGDGPAAATTRDDQQQRQRQQQQRQQ